MLVKLLGNDKETKLDKQDETNFMKPSEAAASETNGDEFLQELKEVLEMSNDGASRDAANASTKAAPEKDAASMKDVAARKNSVSGKNAVSEKADAEKDVTPSAFSRASVTQTGEKTKEPASHFSRDAVDDDALLAELHALIGDPGKPQAVAGRQTSSFTPPSPRRVVPAPRPMARITPDALKDGPEEYEEIAEADTMSIPGWIKGLFILLISLLLGAMTIYAVASDVIGKLF